MPEFVYDPNDPEQTNFVHAATEYYQVFDARTGRLLLQSDALEGLGLHFTPTEVQAYRDQPRIQDLRTDYGRFRISNSVITPSPGEAYLLQVGASLDPMDRALDRYLALLLVTVPIGLIAAVPIGRWVGAIALTPLLRLAARARRIGIADLQQRLPVRGAHDEVDDLAAAFNETLERLQHAVGEMRQFSAALAHELRTPLAALRGEIELALRKVTPGDAMAKRFASQLEEIDKLTRLIDRLLTLARAEAGEIVLAREPADLGAIAGSLVDQLDLVAQAKGVHLERRIQDRVMVEGDPRWLERLLLNLLDNAIKFTPAGGRVAIGVWKDGATAVAEVRDTGIGMPAEVMPHVFERFFRADPARPSEGEGVGLGLSLAKWIVERHNGRIDVESAPGRGSTFTVRLPAV
jgi:heavy metal sensor kinase